MVKRILILLLLAAALGGCINEEATTPPAECVTDADCGTGGCSGQICATADEAADMITTCEYRAEYRCYKITNCGCTEGRCSWKSNENFSECLRQEGG